MQAELNKVVHESAKLKLIHQEGVALGFAFGSAEMIVVAVIAAVVEAIPGFDAGAIGVGFWIVSRLAIIIAFSAIISVTLKRAKARSIERHTGTLDSLAGVYRNKIKELTAEIMKGQAKKGKK